MLLLFQCSIFYMHGKWFFLCLSYVYDDQVDDNKNFSLTLIHMVPEEPSLFSSLKPLQQHSSPKVVSITYLR